MELAILGLGKMGANMARRLARGGHRVVVYNRTTAKALALAEETPTCTPSPRSRPCGKPSSPRAWPG